MACSGGGGVKGIGQAGAFLVLEEARYKPQNVAGHLGGGDDGDLLAPKSIAVERKRPFESGTVSATRNSCTSATLARARRGRPGSCSTPARRDKRRPGKHASLTTEPKSRSLPLPGVSRVGRKFE
jgi:hypothetical protein